MKKHNVKISNSLCGNVFSNLSSTGVMMGGLYARSGDFQHYRLCKSPPQFSGTGY